MNKICTDILQSKKLAEILPLESADMYYSKHALENYYSPIVLYLQVLSYSIFYFSTALLSRMSETLSASTEYPTSSLTSSLFCPSESSIL